MFDLSFYYLFFYGCCCLETSCHWFVRVWVSLASIEEAKIIQTQFLNYFALIWG